MPIPATSGSLRSSLAEMQIGDYISCRYTAATTGVAGTFSELGTCIATEIPVVGSATPNGLFYLIKADKGLLIADRAVQHSVSWDALNTAKFIQGCIPSLPDLDGTPICSSTYPNYSTFQISAYNALFDFGDATKIWMGNEPLGSNAGLGPWLGMHYSESKRIKKLYLHQYNSTSDGTTGFNLEYSNDNRATWHLCEKITTTFASTGKYYDVNALNIEAKDWRVYSDKTIGNGTGEWLIYDLQFITSKPLLFRSLSGGVAYLGTDGLGKLTDQSVGAWPANNEWDEYIVNGDLGGKITPGDNNVWHWSNILTICQDTPINGMNRAGTLGQSSDRINRSYNSSVPSLLQPWFNPSNFSNVIIGFRPVLTYPEDSRCINSWY